MTPYRPDDRLAAFLSGLRDAPSRLLILDYDGTLAPFEEERLRAVPYRGVPERLSRIARAGTRVVVVSGRPVDELASLLGVEPLPELWGSHGWERRRPGRAARTEPLTAEQARSLEAVVEAASPLLPPDRVERKPASVAVHVRGLPPGEARATLERVRVAWERTPGRASLGVQLFDGGMEARVPGHDKGTAVRKIVADEPPDGLVAYLGDDRTDEDAFRALRTRALTVLVREEPRPTLAEAHLVPPHELIAFLDAWSVACAAGGGASTGTPLAPQGLPETLEEPKQPETS